MAITSWDAALAGAQSPADFFKVGGTMEAVGVLHSLFYTSGRPGAAVAPSPGLAGAALTAYAGQLPFANPQSGNSYLLRLCAVATAAGTLLVLDRLWHNSGIVVATLTAQTINSAAWPARDRSESVNGDGICVALEASTATTNSGAISNTTLNYTNQAGVAGRTATMAAWPATAVAGTFVPFQLQAGDTGVRSIQGITLGTSYAGGAIHLVAYRPLAQLALLLPNVGAALDAMTGGFVRVYDNSVPWLVWRPTLTTGMTLDGQLIVTQG